MLNRRIFMSSLALGAVQCASEPRELPFSMLSTLYATAPTEAGDMDLYVDLYSTSLPESPPRPALVLMHGGSFIAGARDLAENQELGRALAARGYVVASISYRLMRDRPVIGASVRPYADAVARFDHPLVAATRAQLGHAWPNAVAAAAEDARRAIDWLRGGQAPAFRIDANRIGMIGMSAGAVTAATLGYLPNLFDAPRAPLAAIVSIRGALLGEAQAGPPLLIAHGGDDDTIPLSEARHFYASAQAAGVKTEFHPVSGFEHDLGGAPMLDAQLDNGARFGDRLAQFLGNSFFRPDALAQSRCIGRGRLC